MLAAVAAGWRLVGRAPGVAGGLLLALVGLALPLSVVLGSAPPSWTLEATDAGEAWHAGWTIECAADFLAGGRTLPEALASIAGVEAGAFASPGSPAGLATASALLLYLGFWIVVTGGVLDRLARDRPVRSAGFFGACGAFGFRLVRLALLAGTAYAALALLFRPDSAEWPGVGAFLAAATVVSVVIDFARVRLVVEDRRSALGALLAGWRFVGRRGWRVAGLYVLNGAVLAAITIAAAGMASGAGSAGAVLSVVLLILAVALRVWARLAFLGAEIAFFQGELAHAGYTAAPERAWPDSAAEEAIRNLASPG